MTDVEVTALTRRSAAFRWRVTKGVDAYLVERQRPGVENDPWLELALVKPTQPMFGDPGLEPATRYMYQFTEIMEEGEVREPLTERVGVMTQPETEFASVQEFVEKFVAPTFRRELTPNGNTVWCDEWWRHAEAVRVMEATWWSYEAHRPAQPPEFPTKARADWFAFHFFPLWDRLVVAHGTFRMCAPGKDKHSIRMKTLPVVVNPTSDYPAAYDPGIPTP